MSAVPPLRPDRMQATVDGQIKRIGMRATLRRSTGDRWCWMFFSQWSARDLMGGLIDPLDRLVVMSAIGLAVAPDHTVDRLITWVQPYDDAAPVEHENLRLTQQPERIAPAGTIVCWKLRVRR